MIRRIEQVRFTEVAPKKKRVAAYARVSSGKDAMLHSLSAQVSYYSEYIQKHGWE
jgi:predicted site-specific integrase-resolvase